MPKNTPSEGRGISPIVAANNRFACEMYRHLSTEGGNVFFSPHSISTALGMVYEGAKGQTADEMASVFHFLPIPELRQIGVAELHQHLNPAGALYELRTANGLWVDNTYPLLHEYQAVVETAYKGAAHKADFRTAADSARQAINAWVEKQTNDKIKNLFPEGSLDSATALVLANAIYFKGNWKTQFNPKLTYKESFRAPDKKDVAVPMMHQSNVHMKYAADKEAQVLEMPYVGEDLSMLVVLPTKDLGSLEKSLTAEKLDTWRGKLSEKKIDQLAFPKFKFDSKYFLNQALVGLGMPTAFTDRADFSGIGGARDLFISMVVHQAYVDVNEEGTEAAAATGVAMGRSCVMEPTIFRADHPFLFLIQENTFGNILFMGRVQDPR